MKQVDRHEVLRKLHYIISSNNDEDLEEEDDSNSNNSSKCKVSYPVLSFHVSNSAVLPNQAKRQDSQPSLYFV
jgi:hypothetical protein